jgi:mitochondrial fission protein ELM1
MVGVRRTRSPSAREPSAFAWAQVSGEPAARAPLTWLLIGTRIGDANQQVALAEALGIPFEIKQIEYNQLRRLPFLRGLGLTIVSKRSRRLIQPPWPDLVIATGYGSVPVARYIRKQSGGRTRIVHIGNPRTNTDDFDLQITTPQYARKPAPNVLALTFPIGNPAQTATATAAELDWLRAFPHPRRLMAIGGPARHWELDHRALRHALLAIRDKQPSGSLIVCTSPRTRPSTRGFLEQLLSGEREALVDDFPQFPVLLAECDELYVTADSVSMISEAALTGKPVGLIPIRRSAVGKLSHWLWEAPFSRRTLPNFRNFWDLLQREKLVGTVELPVASKVCDTVERAAAAVRSLLVAGESVAGGKG